MAKTMRIAAMSVAAAELEQIKSMMSSLRGDAGANWEWIADSNAADALIIDADSLYGHMDWLRAQSSGRNVICLTASNGHEQDNVLHRPIGVGGLKASLLRAAGGAAMAAAADPESAPAPVASAATPAAAAAAVMPKRITGQQPAVTAAAPAPVAAPTPVAPPAAVAAPTPAPVAAATPAPSAGGISAPSLLPRRVTGQQPAITAATPPPVAAPAPAPAPAPVPAAVQALPLADYCLPENMADARKLERDGQPPLIVDAAADRYYGGLTLKPLLPYCLGTIASSEWKPVPAAEIEKLRAMNAGLPLSRLLWLYVIGTSNGTTLLPGFDLNAKYKLVKWPQIEREFPKHFRIGTAMMKGPASLQEIADGSGASVGEVIDFVNAYAAIGFAVQDGGQPISDRRVLIERLRARAV
ncbi:MAG: hypothetical protein IPO95_00750 [Rhodanobacteraceae bacterium]|nr:hypothetical protein [Rhodanobacteraceae bacterium]